MRGAADPPHSARPHPGRRTFALAAALLAIGTAVPFARVIFAGHVLYERDIQAIRWSRLEAFARCLAEGSWPLWNPLAGLGQPMLADPGSQVLYPFTWLSLLLPPQHYYDLYAVAHVLFAGLGTYVLARRLGASFRGALLSGALFLLSGPVLSVTNLWQHLAGAAWVPWVLAAGDAALASPTLARTTTWGAAVAMQMATGSLDFVLLGGIAQAVLAWRYLGLLGERQLEAGRHVLAAAAAAGIALALSAAQWVPAVALLQGASRADLGESARLLWSLHPMLLVQVLAPVFPQDLALTSTARALLYDGREPLLSSIYLGLSGLPFVLAAASSRPRRTPLLLVALALLATALALGRHGLLYFWVVDLLPAAQVFRFPAKAVVLAALAWALLAGLGLEAWRLAGRGVRVAACAAALAASAALALLWLRGVGWAGAWVTADPIGRPPAEQVVPVIAALVPAALLAALAAMVLLLGGDAPRAAPLAAVVMAVELALAHRALPPSLPGAGFAGTPGLIAAAKADGVHRLQMFDYALRRAWTGGASLKADDPPAFRALPVSLRLALSEQEYPLDGARWGVRSGPVSDVAGLESHAREALALLVRYHQEDAGRLARLLRLAGVTHLAARHLSGLDGVFMLRAEVRTLRLGPAYLFRVPEPLARAYAVEGVRRASGPAAYRLLLDPGFDPASEVVLAAGTPRPPAPGFAAQTRLLEDRPDRIRVETTLSRAGQLVVLEGFDRGWRARVDGRTSEPQPANAVFLSVRLEAGHHVVEFVYRPAGVTLGLAVTVVSGLGLMLLLAGRAAAARGSRGTAALRR